MSKSVPNTNRYQNQASNNTFRKLDEGRNTPTTVLIYRNGDEFYPGLRVEITKGMFSNWITFLDFLTQHIKLRTGAVHRIYDMEGHEIRGFKDFQHGGRYVASSGLLNKIKYGQKPPVNEQWREFNGEQILADPPVLESEETLHLYLEKKGFRPDGDGWGSDFDLKRSWKQSGDNNNNNSMEPFRLDKSQAVTKVYASNNTARANFANQQSQPNARNIPSISKIPQLTRINQAVDKNITVAQQFAKNRQHLVSQLREQWHDESSNKLPIARTTNELNKTGNKGPQQQAPEWAKDLSIAIKQLANEVEELRVEGVKVHHDGISMDFNDRQGNNQDDTKAYVFEQYRQSTKSYNDKSPTNKQRGQSTKSAPVSENGRTKKSLKPGKSLAKTIATAKTNKSN